VIKRAREVKVEIAILYILGGAVIALIMVGVLMALL
jgi:hypothetical protein